MYYLLIRKTNSDYAFNDRSADYCIYGKGYRSCWWGYTIEEAIYYYNFRKGNPCLGTLKECITNGGNNIIRVLPFEILDANYIINNYPELFV